MAVDQLSITFAALADPTRRAILARLVSGECSVTELAEPFDMSLPAVSKHLRVLEQAGLIARGREAQWRPCRIEAGPLKEASDWIERYRHIWESRLDRRGDYLKELKQREKDKEKKHGRNPRSK
jgi:DNA-binding transcriptional ArsR family regulator